METLRVAVLPIGNLRTGPAIIGALSTFFGERPIEVAFYDPDDERLELFARFALVAFKFNKATHDITVCDSWECALEGCRKAIFCFDNRGSSEKTSGSTQVKRFEAEARSAVGADVDVLDLSENAAVIPANYRLPLPPELDVEAERALPHQILRWVRGEEYLHEFLAEHGRSPIRDWLERPESALLG